jgi:hypothetical protein
MWIMVECTFLGFKCGCLVVLLYYSKDEALVPFFCGIMFIVKGGFMWVDMKYFFFVYPFFWSVSLYLSGWGISSTGFLVYLGEHSPLPLWPFA